MPDTNHRKPLETIYVGALLTSKDGIILKPHANVLLNHKSETKGAIKLYARRDDVDLINKEQIFQLPSEPITYKCSDHFSWKDHHRDERSLEKNTRKCDDGTLA